MIHQQYNPVSDLTLWLFYDLELKSQELNKFHDCGQLFKWKICDFWGLYTEIHNLPESFRRIGGMNNLLQFIFSGRIRTKDGTRLELSRYVGYAAEQEEAVKQEDDDEQVVNIQ